MISRSALLRSYQRGGWAPGSKHQKHMSMNPTMFLYRFPGPRGPGPYTMKYWWTLGCFPTGLDVPFRLHEFLQSYKLQHVPEEVEEWLSCYITNPVEELISATECLLETMERLFPEIEADTEDIDDEAGVADSAGRRLRRGYTPFAPSIVPLLEPLKKMEQQLLVQLPPAAVRATMANKKLRAQVMDEVFDYQWYVKSYGSTPHRRWARESLEGSSQPADLLEPGDIPNHLSPTLSPHLPSPTGGMEVATPLPRGGEGPTLPHAHVGSAVGAAVSPPGFTAPDEAKLIRILTLFSEGAVAQGNHSEAVAMLSSALVFAQDPASQASVHANLSSALTLDGQFKNAEFHGREAALLYAMGAPSELAVELTHASGVEPRISDATNDHARLSSDVSEVDASTLLSPPKRRSSDADPVPRKAVTQMQRSEDAGARGFAAWSTAVAYQDDFERAAQILEQGLQVHPTSSSLLQLREELHSILTEPRVDGSVAMDESKRTTPRVARQWQGSRAHTAAQQMRGILHGAGKTFSNEFDFIVFNNRLYPSKMNPSTNEMGSVFRRVGDMGGMRSTSRSMEPL